MIKVIGVRFRTAGKIYFFDPVDFEIKKGDHVIVETARGIEFGTVVGGIRQVADDEVIQPLKPVLRVATERDVCQEADNKRREKEAYKLCLEKIREHNLDMKLIDAEFTFDNNKVLFYFTSDGRIDFRELVKDLAAIFKTRIELRQIGVRDETKMVGGIGMCGRPLCCHTHLSDFIPVSIKMAKEQNLSLNPTKISGVCGRLMCCLKHEEETYEELNKNLPHIGDRVTCPDGTQGEVTSVNVLRQLVKVVVENGDTKEILEYKADDIRFVRKGYRQVKAEVSAEELRALELMEKQDKYEVKDSEEKPAGGKKDREDRKQREERGNRGEREERRERSDREERRNRNDREERNQKAVENSDVAVKNTEVDAEVVEQAGKNARGEREERRSRRNRGEREERRERSDREERRNRGEREDRNQKAVENSDVAVKSTEMNAEVVEQAGKEARSEREERGDRGERRSRRNRGEREDRKQREERGNREERRNRNDREDRNQKAVENSDTAVKNVEVSAESVEQAGNDANNQAGSQERRNRSDRKRRFDRHKDRKSDNTELHSDKEAQTTGETQKVKSENVQAAKSESGTKPSEQRTEGEHSEYSRKRNYYRNRRRNRSEGAKEQHES